MLNIFNSFFFLRRGFSHRSAHGKETNEEKRSHQRKLKSIPHRVRNFCLRSLGVFQSLEPRTLIDMFECVFQVGLMMCNSTFSTTTKCAFPIFILNYNFFCARSFIFSWQCKKIFIVRSPQHMKHCGKDALIATVECKNDPCDCNAISIFVTYKIAQIFHTN